jgi:hypothetical protein
MPPGSADKFNYFIGERLTNDQLPDYECITCGWEGFIRSAN